MATGAQYTVRAGRRVHAEVGRARRRSSAGEVGFIIAGIKELHGGEGRRHGHARRRGPRPSRCPASRKSSRRCSRGSIPVESNQYEALRDALEQAASSTTRRCTTSRKCRRRWASASAAASSACCTWTSCRSGSSASTTWTSSPRRRPWSTRSLHARRHGASRSRTRRSCPTCRSVEEIREPIITATILHAAGIRRPGDHAVHRASAACRRTCSTSAAR